MLGQNHKLRPKYLSTFWVGTLIFGIMLFASPSNHSTAIADSKSSTEMGSSLPYLENRIRAKLKEIESENAQMARVFEGLKLQGTTSAFDSTLLLDESPVLAWALFKSERSVISRQSNYVVQPKFRQVGGDGIGLDDLTKDRIRLHSLWEKGIQVIPISSKLWMVASAWHRDSRVQMLSDRDGLLLEFSISVIEPDSVLEPIRSYNSIQKTTNELGETYAVVKLDSGQYAFYPPLSGDVKEHERTEKRIRVFDSTSTSKDSNALKLDHLPIFLIQSEHSGLMGVSTDTSISDVQWIALIATSFFIFLLMTVMMTAFVSKSFRQNVMTKFSRNRDMLKGMTRVIRVPKEVEEALEQKVTIERALSSIRNELKQTKELILGVERAEADLMATKKSDELALKLCAHLALTLNSPMLFFRYDFIKHEFILNRIEGMRINPGVLKFSLSAALLDDLFRKEQSREPIRLDDHARLQELMMDSFGISHFEAWVIGGKGTYSRLRREMQMLGLFVVLSPTSDRVLKQGSFERLKQTAELAFENLLWSGSGKK